LEELFNTFNEEERKHLKQRKNVHNSLLETLMESEFFRKEYTQQELLNNNGSIRKRFTNKTYYDFRGYPVKLNTKKEMRFNFQVKKTKNYKSTSENVNIDKLKKSKITVKELVLSTEGSQTKTQFECWTPMEMFLWWRTLRESGDPKKEWEIMDAVFFLFINQISQIINTYVINFKLNFYSTIIKKYEKNYRSLNIKKYKIKRYNNNDVKIIDPYLKSLFYLKKYLEELDKFYLSGGEYGLLLDVQLLYYEYYEFELHLNTLRHYNNDNSKVLLLKKQNNRISNLNLQSVFFNNKSEINNYELKQIDYKIDKNRSTGNFKSYLTGIKEQYTGNYDLKKFFAKTLEKDNFVLIIFQSYFQNPSKFISLYSIPIIPILGIEFGTHGGGIYSSLQHVHHDLFHAVYLLYFLNNILYHPKFNKNSNEDIQEFFRRTVFLEELNKKALNKNNNERSIYKDAQKLLWWILHEKNFRIDDGGIFNISPGSSQEPNQPKKAVKNFFYIDKLKILLNDLNDYAIAYYSSNENIERITNSISKLIEICDFVLKQDLKYNYRNKNNNENERAAIYGNINNNKVNKKVNKYLKKHPEFTNKNLEEYANNYKIGKIYNTNNQNNINRFKIDFIKRVKDKNKISRYISKFIENNPELSNNNINKLELLLKNKATLEELKKENPNSSNIELLQKLLQIFSNKYSIPKLNNNNASTKNPITLRTLSNQRNAFIRGIMNNPNGSPLNNNNT
jgi:hypothetical protein